eukprot:168363-Rhodomonas_salina.1
MPGTELRYAATRPPLPRAVPPRQTQGVGRLRAMRRRRVRRRQALRGAGARARGRLSTLWCVWSGMGGLSLIHISEPTRPRLI